MFSCPFVEKFSLEIETFYLPGIQIATHEQVSGERKHFLDGGQTENVFSLTDSEISSRSVDTIDVVRDQDQNYVAEEVNTNRDETVQLNFLLFRTSPYMSQVRPPGAPLTRTGWRPSARDVSGSSSQPGEQCRQEFSREY